MTLMTEKRIRHLPVIENDKVVGIVSIGDIVNTIINSQSEAIKSLESYIHGGAISE
jgi:CBS domain-containing protein